MSQQSQPVAVPFNALKPATWGSLKLLPLALRSKLTGAKGSDDINRVGFGKENAGGQPVAPQAPPKLGDLSHLQALGPRRNVNQRYVLQPNLTVSRPALAAHAPGLSGLLLPGMAPIVTQYPKQQQQQAQQQHQHALQPHNQQQQSGTPSRQQQQRSATPSSPSLRGRQPQANPNFANPNIATRLPTPVRINAASPGPSLSPTSLALSLPKPPSPSRSLSQSGAAPLANPFAYGSACSSPAVSTATSNTFALPTPPSILDNAPPPPAVALRSSAYNAAPRASAPWAASGSAAQGQGLNSGGANASLTPTSTRPSPPPPERSILASVQLPNQQQQNQHHHALRHGSVVGAAGAALPGHSEGLALVAAPAPALAAAAAVSPVLSAPAIQAALQQALQGAVERKPEAFRLDNFERFFDSLMHPGDAGKLDGPLPDELPDDLRYGDAWYKHCRDWNGLHKPAAPYSAPTTATAAAAAADASAAAGPATPVSCRLASTPFAAAAEPLVWDRDQDRDQRRQGTPQWSLDEPPLSESCCKALDIAHHGLRKVLTPTARSRSVSVDLTPLGAAATAQRTPASATSQQPSLLERFQLQQRQQQCASAAAAAVASAAERELEDTAASRQAAAAAGPEVAHTAATLTSALETLARGQQAVATAASAHQASSAVQQAAAEADMAAATAAAVDSAALELSPDVTPRDCGSAAMKVAAGRRFAVPALLISSMDAATAAGGALSPPPDSARPPSTAATTPGHKTPRGGGGGAADSVVTTAATTPVGRAATPTTARTKTSAKSAASPVFESVQAATVVGTTTHGPEGSVALTLRKLSGELAAADLATDRQTAQPSLAAPEAEPAVPSAAVSADAMPPALLWSPAFPPVAQAAAMVRVAAAAAGTVPQRSSSPVTLLQNAPRDMPTPNPAFFGGAAVQPAAGPSSLAAAVAAVTAPGQSGGAAAAAGPSNSTAPPAADPLKEIVVGIEKLSTLKQNILAEDKEVDVASITQMIQLKLAVEQLLAKTSSAAAHDATAPAPVTAASTAASQPAPQPAAAAAGPQDATPKKQSRSTTFGAFLKSVFSPRSGSASKAQQATAATAAPVAPAPASTAKGPITAATAHAIGSPSVIAVGVRAPLLPMSASAAPRQVASPSLSDRSRYAALHQRAAARLAEAAAEPTPAARPAPAAASRQPGAQQGSQGQRGDVWQRYEAKIAMHRQQLDTTKSQLDEAVRKLNDMQAEFDELLLCLGMESAKNKALCEAMRAAGLDPEPILAAIEEQWMSGSFPE